MTVVRSIDRQYCKRFRTVYYTRHIVLGRWVVENPDAGADVQGHSASALGLVLK